MQESPRKERHKWPAGSLKTKKIYIDVYLRQSKETDTEEDLQGRRRTYEAEVAERISPPDERGRLEQTHEYPESQDCPDQCLAQSRYAQTVSTSEIKGPVVFAAHYDPMCRPIEEEMPSPTLSTISLVEVIGGLEMAVSEAQQQPRRRRCDGNVKKSQSCHPNCSA
eukprot:3180312-Amphidinium_carterae.1